MSARWVYNYLGRICYLSCKLVIGAISGMLLCSMAELYMLPSMLNIDWKWLFNVSALHFSCKIFYY